MKPAWQFGAAPDSLVFEAMHVSCEGDVLIIGDSHALLCGGDRAFPGCDLSARKGRESGEGLEMLGRALRDRHDVIVFDISTNDVLDPRALGVNLEQLRERIEGRQLVLVNTWRDDFRNLHLRVNEVLGQFTERHRSDVALVDWAAHIDGHPAPLGPDSDCIHFTTDVYRDRIALVSEAIDRARSRVPVSSSESHV